MNFIYLSVEGYSILLLAHLEISHRRWERAIALNRNRVRLLVMAESSGGPRGTDAGSGLRSTRTTGVFRVVNFELFARPVSSASGYFISRPLPP